MTAHPASSSSITPPAPQTPKAHYRVRFPFWQREAEGQDSQKKSNAWLETTHGSYRAALIMIASMCPLPIVTTLITALLYVGLLSVPQIAFFARTAASWWTLVIIGGGFVLTILLWLLVSLGFISSTSFYAANPTSASHFIRHFAIVKAIYKTLVSYNQATHTPSSLQPVGRLPYQTLDKFIQAYPVDYQMALDSINQCLQMAEDMVRKGTYRWVRGNGYLSAWQLVHRAEETMFIVGPLNYVIREAMHDAAAISGTQISNADIYLSNLDMAVKALSPSSAIYLHSLLPLPNVAVTQPPSQGHQPVPGSIQASWPQQALSALAGAMAGSHGPTSSGMCTKHTGNLEEEMAARSALRHARSILNEYRAGLWDNLLRMRGQLFGTAIGVSLLTLLLLYVAIGGGIPSSALLAGLIFYLVGAISGLFGRLITESQSDKAIDDYGLTVARVVVTPVISGLAALAGVLLVSLLSVNIFNTPGQDINKGVPLPDLSQIYDLVQNRQGLVIAALFGLTPNRFINLLQAKTEDTKAQLRSSMASRN